MIRILIIDDSAEVRNKIAETIQSAIATENMHRFSASVQSLPPQHDLSNCDQPDYSSQASASALPIKYKPTYSASRLPTISLRGCTYAEALLIKEAEIIIASAEFSRSEGNNIKILRRALPNILIAAIVNEGDFTLVDNLLRQGIDEVLDSNISITTILKLVFKLQQRTQKQSLGKLIMVDSPKGGVGVTTVTAALADFLCGDGRKVVLIDLDHQTQDLSRFLGITQIINDNLSLLLSGNRPLLSEFINDCCTPLWQSSAIMTPPPGDFLQFPNSVRRLYEVIDRLTDLYDYVIVDCASHDLNILRPLYQRADEILLTVSADHSLFHATLEKIRRLSQEADIKADILLLENNYTVPSISSKFFKAELARYSFTAQCRWCPDQIPFSPMARCWPGTKQTFLAFLPPKRALRVFRSLSRTIGLATDKMSVDTSSLKSAQSQRSANQEMGNLKQRSQSHHRSHPKAPVDDVLFEGFSKFAQRPLGPALMGSLRKNLLQIATKIPKLIEYQRGESVVAKQLKLPPPLVSGAVLVRKSTA